MPRFRDRREAGRALAHRLHERFSTPGAPLPIVVGLPRGGVPVAAEIARALGAPLDVVVVRKLGVPDQPELGMGAVGEDGVRVLNPDILRVARVSDDAIARVEAREQAEVVRRAARFRAGRPRLDLAGRTVVVVDDGIATGGTVRAALQIVRVHGAARVVLAVPVSPPDTLAVLETEADEVVCLATPVPFFGVGQWYDDFTQVTDDEVVRILADAHERGAAPSPAGGARDEEVSLPVDGRVLAGHLFVPEGAHRLVLFAHGSGSNRFSPRNVLVGDLLAAEGTGTLLFDLLTESEARDRAAVFDVELLARRLVGATRWAMAELPGLRLGYFGASTGAAGALLAAAALPEVVGAVVSRGGRPDLATSRLGAVRAPTLLIVGGDDPVVLELNRDAARHLRVEHRVEIVPGAGHLFEGPRQLETVARLASGWFRAHLDDSATRS